MKSFLTYLLRSVKYFIYLAIILILVLYVLSLAGMTEWDVDVMFSEGTKSVWKIAGMLAVMSLVYPSVGFQRRKAVIAGSWEERKEEIVAVLEDKGYVLRSETPDGAVFRSRNIIHRLFRMFEDKVVIRQDFGGFELEGLRKDIVRLVMHLEYRLSSGDN